MRKLIIFLLWLSILIINEVAAEDSSYVPVSSASSTPQETIEIIIFSSTTKLINKDDPELFPQHVGELNKAGALELTEQQPLKTLLTVYNKLKKDHKYHVIFHTSVSYNLPISQRNKKFSIKATDFSGIVTVTPAPIKNTFNIAFDGIFSDSYRLTKSTKLKSKDTYYFDHPMFGAIVTIN